MMEITTPGAYFSELPHNVNAIGNKVETPKPEIQNPISAGQNEGITMAVPIPMIINNELITKVFSKPILAMIKSERKREIVIHIIKLR